MITTADKRHDHHLVIKADADRSPSRKFPELEDSWEPAFHEFGTHLLPAIGLQKKQIRRLMELISYRIGRNPRDLVSHVRRIFLARASGDADATFEACKALFSVLKDKGWGLRTLILQECAVVLGEARQRRLLAFSQSLMTNTIESIFPSRPLVISEDRLPTRQASAISAVDEAHEFLDHGQVMEARHCLENHLLHGTAHREAHELLLEIYRRAGDRAALNTMRARLPDLPQEIAAMWATTAQSMTKA